MEKALNICFITQEYPPYSNWGGIATYYQDFANACRNLGHDVTVISRMNNGSPKYQKTENGIKIWRIGKNIKRKKFVGRTIDKILYSKAVYKKIKDLEKNIKFHFIEVPEVSLEGDILIKDPSYAKRTIIHCHGGNALTVMPKGILSLLHRIDVKWCLRREFAALKRAGKITVSSKSSYKYLTKNSISKSNIYILPQGIDTDSFKPASTVNHKKYLEVGFVGRLEEPKGIDFLWKIIERIMPEDKIHFHLKGKIHWANADIIRNKLKQYKKIVTYYPNSPYDEMPKFYQSLNVLIQPSRFETFGRVYIEAMASKLIVFAGKKGGGAEIITDNQNGYLIDPESKADVNRVVEMLKSLAKDKERYAYIKNNARNEVLEKYNLNNLAKMKVNNFLN